MKQLALIGTNDNTRNLNLRHTLIELICSGFILLHTFLKVMYRCCFRLQKLKITTVVVPVDEQRNSCIDDWPIRNLKLLPREIPTLPPRIEAWLSDPKLLNYPQHSSPCKDEQVRLGYYVVNLLAMSKFKACNSWKKAPHNYHLF
jgi:hypothetical protein